MKHDLTLIALISQSNEPIEISFSEFPKECTYIHFKANGQEFNLTADSLKQDAIKEISDLSEAFGVNPLDELEITFDDGDILRIASDGNHIRFTSGDKEIGYWVCDEFEEESETENILGAIAGITINRDNLKNS